MSSDPEAGEDGNMAAGDDTKKSERKRQRERERRSNLAQAFDDLASVLSQIEPDVNEDETGTRQRRRRNSAEIHEIDTGDNAGLTRLDLIGRGVDTLRRLHDENTRLRELLEESGIDSKKTQSDLLMAPTMTKTQQKSDRPVSSTPPPYPHPSYPPPAPPHHHYYSQPPPPIDYRYYPRSQHPPPGYPTYHYGSGGWTTSASAPSLPPPHHRFPPPISQYPPAARTTASTPPPAAVQHGDRPSPQLPSQQSQPPRRYESPQTSASSIHRTNSKG